MKRKKFFELMASVFEFLKSRVVVHAIYVFIAFLIGWFLSDTIKMADLNPVISTLQNLSAAVFTLAGIWIAYSYPQAISAYTSPGTVKVIPTDETKRIENLVLIVLTSAFVISSLLVFNFIYLLVSKTGFYAIYSIYFKTAGVASVCYLSFLQLKAILVVMFTNISFVNELHGKRTEKIANDDL